MQVGPEPDPTRDYTQHHHISLGGTREGPWAAQEASPWPRRWSDSSWVPNREEYFLRLEIILRPTCTNLHAPSQRSPALVPDMRSCPRARIALNSEPLLPKLLQAVEARRQ